MRLLLVAVLVVLVTVVVSDDPTPVDFTAIFAGARTASEWSEAAEASDGPMLKHWGGGGRWGGSRWGGGRRPRPRPRPRPYWQDSSSDDDWRPRPRPRPWWVRPNPWGRPRPQRPGPPGPPGPATTTTPAATTTTAPAPSTTTALPVECQGVGCDFFKASCDLTGDITGQILFAQSKTRGSAVAVNYLITGIPTTTGSTAAVQHGLHIHQYNDTSDGCSQVGSHYNPLGATHGNPSATVDGLPDTTKFHVGDLGNIKVNPNGVTQTPVEAQFINPLIRVFADIQEESMKLGTIVHRSVVLHASPDDLGEPGTEASLTTGNAGTKLACCAITPVYQPGEEHWYLGYNDPIGSVAQ